MYEGSSFGCADHRSPLASLGEGRECVRRCSLRCDHLTSLFFFRISKYYSLPPLNSGSAARELWNK